MFIFFEPIKNERKTFYTEGRIVDIKRIPILSFCKNSILTFRKENGEEVKIYAYMTQSPAELYAILFAIAQAGIVFYTRLFRTCGYFSLFISAYYFYGSIRSVCPDIEMYGCTLLYRQRDVAGHIYFLCLQR